MHPGACTATPCRRRRLSVPNEVVVRLLLDHGAEINGSSDGSPLQAAAKSGNEAIVKLLLEFRANISAVGPYGTALQAATSSGRTSIVQLLLASQQEVNARITDVEESLTIAAREGNENMARILLEATGGIESVPGNSSAALSAAIFSGNERMIRLLLDSGASVGNMGKDLQSYQFHSVTSRIHVTGCSLSVMGALAYVNKVRIRFLHEPRKYQEFLCLLARYVTDGFPFFKSS